MPVMSPVYSGNVEADPDVALRAEMVDLVGLDIVQQVLQRGAVAEVAVVQEELHAVDVRVLVKMIDAVGVERTGAADDAVDLVALAEQEFGEIRPVLPGDTGN